MVSWQLALVPLQVARKLVYLVYGYIRIVEAGQSGLYYLGLSLYYVLFTLPQDEILCSKAVWSLAISFFCGSPKTNGNKNRGQPFSPFLLPFNIYSASRRFDIFFAFLNRQEVEILSFKHCPRFNDFFQGRTKWRNSRLPTWLGCFILKRNSYFIE